ncbi:MAG: DUF58 domain-containing protein [Pseudomonadales bacterium]|jgi:uncharacterized protein (DUF58 family)|nr:DUF58 domain-containing protein [Pseudomonadales bacterium]MDP6471335.1 DUF58 domain-containing protein [Pseudomonadales bacterium]MDP6826474.1 DUF58 domain-containing protein [Pseudomonadales bacterium]MDP6970071.1 DUF58 domain-containing protein [Pseudomonadales bacterium]|tara:strand:+ start:685 stop:1617 length:933 start_codon:yes stop_codon:yes gene_type:complete
MSEPQHASSGEPQLLKGAYAALEDLLALRHWRVNRGRKPPRSRAQIAGQRLSKLRGRGVDFAEVRLYQPGDDIRTIDWRVTARKNKPHTKVFREERERPTLIVVDQTQTMFFGSSLRLKSVAAAESASIAAWQALAHNDRVGGIVIGNQSAPSHKPLRSVKAVARLLADVATQNQALSRHTRTPDEDRLREALFGLRRLVRTNYRVLMVSDFSTHPHLWYDALREVSRHNEVTMLRIYDPLEQDLPPADRYTVTDGYSRWQFHSGDADFRRTYSRRFVTRDDELRALCNGHAARFISRSTLESPDTPVWF